MITIPYISIETIFFIFTSILLLLTSTMIVAAIIANTRRESDSKKKFSHLKGYEIWDGTKEKYLFTSYKHIGFLKPVNCSEKVEKSFSLIRLQINKYAFLYLSFVSSLVLCPVALIADYFYLQGALPSPFWGAAALFLMVANLMALMAVGYFLLMIVDLYRLKKSETHIKIQHSYLKIHPAVLTSLNFGSPSNILRYDNQEYLYALSFSNITKIKILPRLYGSRDKQRQARFVITLSDDSLLQIPRVYFDHKQEIDFTESLINYSQITAKIYGVVDQKNKYREI